MAGASGRASTTVSPSVVVAYQVSTVWTTPAAVHCDRGSVITTSSACEEAHEGRCQAARRPRRPGARASASFVRSSAEPSQGCSVRSMGEGLLRRGLVRPKNMRRHILRGKHGVRHGHGRNLGTGFGHELVACLPAVVTSAAAVS